MLAIFAQHDNIQIIIDIFHHNSKLNLTLFKIIVPIVNSFKPLINGLSCDPHPLISAYYLGNKNQMPVPFNLSLLETSKVP